MVDTFLSAALVSVITGFIGVLVSVLGRRLERLREQDVERVREIATTVEAQANAQRARVVEAVAERIIDPKATEDILRRLEDLGSKINVLGVDPKSLTSADSTWALVEDLVTSYHRQALSQARVQFWFSIVAACVGFGMIMIALAGALGESQNGMDVFLNTLPGVAINAVAALFFKQAGETRERATALYDRLRTDRQRMESIQLVDSIDNSDVRNAVKAELVLHMAGLQSSPLASLLPSLLQKTTSQIPPATTADSSES